LALKQPIFNYIGCRSQKRHDPKLIFLHAATDIPMKDYPLTVAQSRYLKAVHAFSPKTQ
jgi:hypothetical protein